MKIVERVLSLIIVGNLVTILVLALMGGNGRISGLLSAAPAAPRGTTAEERVAGPLWRDASPVVLAGTRLVELSDSMADVVERVSPALVAITTRGPLAVDLPEDHPAIPEGRTTGEGSGFIIHESGVVVTNAHVVDNTSDVVVQLHSGQRRHATVIGADEKSDLALLRLEGEGAPYPVLALGRSRDLRTGEIVLSCGNTFGLGTSIGLGILSGTRRDPAGTAGWVGGYLQTDAKIKPGNSGGPLLNSRGEVVGIASAVTGPLLDIGLAIPIDAAKIILPHLYDKGSYPRGYLGVNIRPIAVVAEAYTSEMTANEDDEITAVQIIRVLDGTGAERARLQPGDIIVEAGGRRIRSSVDLQEAVGRLVRGDEVQLVLLRDGRLLRRTVFVGDMPEQN
jgi:serine protease Do